MTTHKMTIYFLLCCTGADVPETEAGSGSGEDSNRAGALQEVADTAADTLAKKQPLQRIPSEVTPTCQHEDPQPPAASPSDLRVYFFTAWSSWLRGAG